MSKEILNYRFLSVLIPFTFIIPDLVYNLISNKNVLYDFSRFFNSKIKTYICVISIISIITLVSLYLKSDNYYCVIILFAVSIISLFLTSPKALVKNGIRLDHYKSALIEWGDVQSYEFINSKKQDKIYLDICYIGKGTSDLKNRKFKVRFDDKHDLDAFLLSQKNKFNQEVKKRVPLYSISKTVVIVLLSVMLIYYGN